MCNVEATWTTTTFCRKCFKLRSCLNTNNSSEYKYLCLVCSKEMNLIGSCKSCGSEGVKSALDMQGGYCWKCHNDNITECDLCGVEDYTHNFSDGICNKCISGLNKACNKCGDYFSLEKLNNDGLCEKCTIKIYKILQQSKVDEVVECIECGREQLVSNLENGLCMFCYKDNEIKKLKKDIKNIKRKVYS